MELFIPQFDIFADKRDKLSELLIETSNVEESRREFSEASMMYGNSNVFIEIWREEDKPDLYRVKKVIRVNYTDTNV
jgi:uncharacterized protein with PhoU and TrkA domain